MSTITSSIIKKDHRAEVIALFQTLARDRDLTPGKLVDIARDEDHVLHGYFEWHDGVAAEKFRQGQARQLIQSVKVRVVTAPEQVTHVRAILSLPPKPESGDMKPRYTMTSDIASSDDAMERIKEQAVVELSRVRKKYEGLAQLPEFARIFETIDKLAA